MAKGRPTNLLVGSHDGTEEEHPAKKILHGVGLSGPTLSGKSEYSLDVYPLSSYSHAMKNSIWFVLALILAPVTFARPVARDVRDELNLKAAQWIEATVKIAAITVCGEIDPVLVGDACEYEAEVVESKKKLPAKLRLFYSNRVSEYQPIFSVGQIVIVDLEPVDPKVDNFPDTAFFVRSVVENKQGKFDAKVEQMNIQVTGPKNCKLVGVEDRSYQCTYAAEWVVSPQVKRAIELRFLTYSSSDGVREGDIQLSRSKTYTVLAQPERARHSIAYDLVLVFRR